jgi:hypothetical protein
MEKKTRKTALYLTIFDVRTCIFGMVKKTSHTTVSLRHISSGYKIGLGSGGHGLIFFTKEQ